MKRFFMVTIVLLCSKFVLAQDTAFLTSFNQQRIQTTKKAMVALGGWAVANIATGFIACSPHSSI